MGVTVVFHSEDGNDDELARKIQEIVVDPSLKMHLFGASVSVSKVISRQSGSLARCGEWFENYAGTLYVCTQGVDHRGAHDWVPYE